MFKSQNLTYILTILEAIEKIFYYSKNFENEEEFYLADKQVYFNATVHLLIAIGEEHKKIDEKLKTSKDINWKNISAMRDEISHNYRGIDETVVWDIIVEYLPKLKNIFIEILPLIEDYKLYIQEAIDSQYYEDLIYLKELLNDNNI